MYVFFYTNPFCAGMCMQKYLQQKLKIKCDV